MGVTADGVQGQAVGVRVPGWPLSWALLAHLPARARSWFPVVVHQIEQERGGRMNGDVGDRDRSLCRARHNVTRQGRDGEGRSGERTRGRARPRMVWVAQIISIDWAAPIE